MVSSLLRAALVADISVVGAGMGGMAAAARLAVAGHRVTVYERTGTHGGAVRRFTRDGFGFDTGPGLLNLPAVYRDLFVKTGREPLEECVRLLPVEPAARHVFADGTAVTLPGISRARTVEALDTALGEGAGARWSTLLGRARRTWEAARRPLLEEPLVAGRALPADLSSAVRGPERGWARLRRTPATLAALARQELRDPRLVALLESHALGHGFDPRRVPAEAIVLPYVEQTFGTWYVAGGMRALADAVYERCRVRGVEFVFGAEVTRVREKDGRAAGVELSDGRVVEADAVVVAGGSPAGAAASAAGTAPVPTDGVAGEAKGRVTHGEAKSGVTHGEAKSGVTHGEAKSGVTHGEAKGRFTVLLALSGARPEGTAHRTVVHAADREAELTALSAGGLCDRPTVTVLRPDDPALRPGDGYEAVTLTVTVPPDGPVDWAAPGAAERCADRVIAAADAAGLGLGGRVRWREVRTPAHSAEETGAAGGAVPGPALAGAGGAFLPVANAGGLPGLYRAGGFAHPGGGLAHTGMSGALAAGLIIEGNDWRGSY